MPISGLVLSLAPGAEAQEAVLAAVQGDRRVTPGELNQAASALPLVAETGTLEEHDALWKDLAALPGVLMVRLAFHDFSDIATPEENGG